MNLSASIQTFIHMHGYGQFVWSAYGITAVVMIVNILIPWRQRRLLKRDMQRHQQQEQW